MFSVGGMDGGTDGTWEGWDEVTDSWAGQGSLGYTVSDLVWPMSGLVKSALRDLGLLGAAPGSEQWKLDSLPWPEQ